MVSFSVDIGVLKRIGDFAGVIVWNFEHRKIQ